jgi:hypothetical protein
MNIYAIEAFGKWGGGCAIVAADSEAEAIKTAQTQVKSHWNVDFNLQSQVKTLLYGICCGPCLLHFYEMGE